MVLIVLLYAVFAGTFSLGKHILQYTQPIFIIGLRMSIAGALILAYQHFRAKNTHQLKLDHWPLYIKIMFLTVFIPYILRGWGLGFMSSCKASFLYNSGPFISYLLSCALYAEKPRLKKILGLVIGFIGLLPVLLSSQKSSIDPVCWVWSFLPELAMIISVSCISYGWLVAHDLIRRYHYHPMLLNGLSMLGGGSLALGTSLLLEDSSNYITNPVPFFIMLAIIIVMSNLICHNLYASLLRTYTPTMMSFASFMTPFFAGLYGWIFMGEAITWQFCIANIIVMMGLALFYSEELIQMKQQENIQPAQNISLHNNEEAIAQTVEIEAPSYTSET